MDWQIYLSGEIHSNWREEIIETTEKEHLPIKFFGPVTNHDASDDCGVCLLYTSPSPRDPKTSRMPSSA